MVFKRRSSRSKAAKPATTKDADRIFKRGQIDGDTRCASSSWTLGDDLVALASDSASELYFSNNRVDSRHEISSDLGTVYLGSASESSDTPVGWCDDKHIITVAGSRAGKGVSAILPNLHLYRGSMICIDPKGENARFTAIRRAEELGQDVHILDPYNIVKEVPKKFKSAFDPLADLFTTDPEIIEKINAIADALIISSGGKDAHWDEMSRAFIAAVIGHVITDPQLGYPRNLPTVRMLIQNGDPLASERYRSDTRTTELIEQGEGDDAVVVAQEYYEEIKDFDALLWAMAHNSDLDGMISGFAQRLTSMGFEERGSVLSSTDRHTRFLDGKSMQSVLVKPQGNKKRLKLDKLKTSKKPMSIYICLPTRYLATHARWLRLMINSIFAAVETSSTEPPPDGRMILAVLDEFPVLGYMKSIEAAVGYMAGYHIRIWAILQDLSQLKRDYPRSWETFLGNTGLQQFFGNTDHTTLEYISKSLGETEITRLTMSTNRLSENDRASVRENQSGAKAIVDGQGLGDSYQYSEQILKVPLMSHDEIRVLFSREKRLQVLLASGYNPIVAYRELYYELKRNGGLEKLSRL